MGTLNLKTNAGGSVIFEPQNTATDRTVLVPAASGTMATTDQVMGMKNAIINGAMLINQRNATITTNLVPGGAAIEFSADRWKSYGFNATGNFDAVLTTQQFNDHPSSGANGRCLRVLVTTADTVTSGTDFFVLRHDIEAANSYHFYNKPLSLSFWVKTSTIGTYGVQLRAVGTTDALATPNFISTYTVSAADTWEYKTIFIPPQTLSTTLPDNSNGYSLYMTLVSGQNENSPGGSGIAACLNQWARYSSDGIASSTLSNTLTAANGRYFQLTEVQLEVGGAATPFERRPVSLELALCQRYYVQTPAFSWSFDYPMNGGGYWAGNSHRPARFFELPVEMRVAPTTVVTYSISGWTAAETNGASSATGSYGNRTVFWMTPMASTGGGNPYIYDMRFTCTAEL
jgi:hypothetical protein